MQRWQRAFTTSVEHEHEQGGQDAGSYASQSCSMPAIGHCAPTYIPPLSPNLLEASTPAQHIYQHGAKTSCIPWLMMGQQWHCFSNASFAARQRMARTVMAWQGEPKLCLAHHSAAREEQKVLQLIECFGIQHDHVQHTYDHGHRRQCTCV